MAKHHFTVHVEVKEVTPAMEKVEYNKIVSSTPRDVSDVVQVTTRADTKAEAVDKAIRMLEAEAEEMHDGE